MDHPAVPRTRAVRDDDVRTRGRHREVPADHPDVATSPDLQHAGLLDGRKHQHVVTRVVQPQPIRTHLKRDRDRIGEGRARERRADGERSSGERAGLHGVGRPGPVATERPLWILDPRRLILQRRSGPVLRLPRSHDVDVSVVLL